MPRRKKRAKRQQVSVQKNASGNPVMRWREPNGFDDNGKRIYRQRSVSLAGLSKVEQDAAVAKKVKELAARRLQHGANVVIHAVELDAGKTYVLDQMRAEGCSASTVTKHERLLDQFIAWLDSRRIRMLSEVTTSLLVEWKETRLGLTKSRPIEGGGVGAHAATDEGRSPATVSGEMADTSAWLNRWRGKGWVLLDRDDIADATALPRLVRQQANVALRSRKGFLDRDGIRILLDACERHDTDTFALTRDERRAGVEPGDGRTTRHDSCTPLVLGLLLTGCRTAELRRIEWDHIHWHRPNDDGDEVGCISLPSEIAKWRIPRDIDLGVSPGLRRLLQALHLQSGGTPFVFGGARALSDQRVRGAFKRLREDYGVPDWVTPKVLRRTCGTYLVCAPGIPFTTDTAAQQLGHSPAVAVRHYHRQLHGVPTAHTTLDAAMDLATHIEGAISRITGGETVGTKWEQKPPTENVSRRNA